MTGILDLLLIPPPPSLLGDPSSTYRGSSSGQKCRSLTSWLVCHVGKSVYDFISDIYASQKMTTATYPALHLKPSIPADTLKTPVCKLVHGRRMQPSEGRPIHLEPALSRPRPYRDRCFTRRIEDRSLWLSSPSLREAGLGSANSNLKGCQQHAKKMNVDDVPRPSTASDEHQFSGLFGSTYARQKKPVPRSPLALVFTPTSNLSHPALRSPPSHCTFAIDITTEPLGIVHSKHQESTGESTKQGVLSAPE
ncbi:hypothetical protein BKA70DRAFT_1505257 [Coprinopsis sp. MPI-PUGE-AT-0042]|nr:hypothetical protein BKA70DRAFT_1505257 [Coprinopsis sp. MPI-PUGE-AT-0042]